MNQRDSVCVCVCGWRGGVCGGVVVSGDLARRKIRKGSIDRRQRENKQTRIMREG